MYGFTREDLDEFDVTPEDLSGEISSLTLARIARGLLVRILREDGRFEEIAALKPLPTRSESSVPSQRLRERTDVDERSLSVAALALVIPAVVVPLALFCALSFRGRR
jgi:hypothetical protein